MALDVGELVAHLRLDRSDFDRGVDQSEGRFSKLAGTLGTAVVRIGAAAGAGIAAAGAVGLSTAARMEQAEIGFTTMLGSGQRAKAFLTDLSAFAAKTPFEFPELQTAASSLVSAGIEADKVIPIMTTLGDVTSGMGTGSEGIKRATIALQQMNAAGRITGEDLNQLRDAGIPVYDLLANATGKSKEEVVALAQAGKLGKVELDAMMKALETGGGLEKFTGLMGAQSKSLTGMWSTLKDTFSVGMAEAIQPLIPLIKDGLGGATVFVADNMPRLRDGLTQAVAAVRSFVGGADADKTSRFGDAVEQARSAVGDLRPALRDVADALPSMNDAISLGGAALGFLADNLDTVIEYMPLIITAFVVYKTAQAAANAAQLASLPVQAAAVAANIAGAVANNRLATAIAQQTAVQNVNAVATSRGTIATVAHTVAGVAASAATKGMTAAQWLLNAALTANPIGLVIAAIALLIGGLILAYQNSETFRNIVDGAFRAVQGAAEFAFNWIRDNWQLLLAIITGPIGLAVLAVVTHFDTIKAVVQTVIRFVAEGFLSMVAGALGGLQSLADAAGRLPGPLGAPFRAASEAISAARDRVGDLRNAIDALPSNKSVKVQLSIDSSALLRGAQTIRQLEERAAGGGGDGPGRPSSGGSTLARVMPVLNRLGGYVTSSYRSPAQNARVGGSPRSYHLDRNNPAIDIGGSKSVLSSVAATLRSMGGWRELIWQAPGHYDHVHVADKGGIFRGPGYVRMGAGDEMFASGLGARKIADLPATMAAARGGDARSADRSPTVVHKHYELGGIHARDTVNVADEFHRLELLAG